MRSAPGIRLLALAVWLAAAAAAAQTAEPDTTAAQNAAPDTAAAQNAAPDTAAAAEPEAPAPTGLQAMGQGLQQGDVASPEPVVADGPFFVGFDNKPKVGVRADVSKYEYYGEWKLSLKMRRGSQLDNTLTASRAEYRKYNKVIRSLRNQLLYNAGVQLPVILTVDGLYDRTDDVTDNNAIRREATNGTVKARRNSIRTGALYHNVSGSVGARDDKSENRDIGTTIREGEADARLQTSWEIREGVTLAGRLYGEGSSGTRSLDEDEAPSRAVGDTLGVGAYYDRGWILGRAVLTTSEFDSRYIDWQRGQTGAVDTLGRPPEDHIVDEQEVKKQTAMVWDNQLELGRLGLTFNLARDFDEVALTQSAAGTRKNQDESMTLETDYAAGRDSLVVGYRYGLIWDDQEYQDGSQRGRQSTKRRGLNFGWFHTLFRATELRFGFGQDLSQQIPDAVRQNGQNRDQLTTNAAVQLSRNWARFRTSMIFGWNQRQDIAINSSQSIQNNTKDSYELAPQFNWTISPWLRLSQRYKLWIQYTAWDYPSDSRVDDYNKRGNLNTFLTISPTERIEVTIEHDYNRRFNATQSGTNAEGGSVYLKDQIQTINNIDFGVEFEAAEGVILEASTYRKKDYKTFPQNDNESTSFAGEIWVGTRVNKRWGRKNPLELSALLKKYNAFGPSVQPTSRDYWVADVWVKWSF